MNAITEWLLNFPPIRRLVSLIAIGPIHPRLPCFRFLPTLLCGYRERPHPLSLWSPDSPAAPVQYDPDAPCEREKRTIPAANYTAWPSLVDRRYTGRHLGPRDDAHELPPVDALLDLLVRPDNTMVEAPTTSALFPMFAQWFTDSFLRTHPYDRRLNTSNHEIDLCQLYGLTQNTAWRLRATDANGAKKAELATGLAANGGEVGARLFEKNTAGDIIIAQGFEQLPYLCGDPNTEQLKCILDNLFFDLPQERRLALYATGLERGNSTVGYSTVNAIFRREHNRLVRQMRRIHPEWDEDRCFETARNTNIAVLIKIILEDYIGHLAGTKRLRFDPGFADWRHWYRTNRIAIEFDLLYRWHGLVPNTLHIAGEDYRPDQFMYNNLLLERHGAERIITDLSKQPAGKITLGNVPQFLRGAEQSALAFSRQFNLQPYNAYCRHFGVRPATSFRELTGEHALSAQLSKLYNDDIEQVEFMVGLRAENVSENKPLGKLMKKMVGIDAFSQALTNPLLSRHVFTKPTFSEVGWKTIEQTRSFSDVVMRNRVDTIPPEQIIASFERR